MLAFEEGREAGISDFISEVEYTDDQPFEGFKDTGVFSICRLEIFLSAGSEVVREKTRFLLQRSRKLKPDFNFER